jgi:hypothetical protein
MPIGKQVHAILVCSVVALAPMNRSGRADEAAEAPWKTYRNAKLGLEIQYPASGTTDERPNDYVDFSSSSPEMLLTFGLMGPPEKARYTDFNKWVGKPYSKPDGVGGHSVLERKHLKVGPLSAFSLKVENHLGPHTIQMQAWFAVPYADRKRKGGIVYALSGQVDAKDPKAAEAGRIFDRMVRSVKMQPVAE